MYGKKKARFVIEKCFFTIPEIATMYDISEKEAIYESIKVGAYYQIGRLRLINRCLFECKYKKIEEGIKEVEGKYCSVEKAMKFFGMNEKQVVQLASDASALIKLSEVLMVNIEVLDEYVLRFEKRVQLIDQATFDMEMNERRRKVGLWLK